MVSLALRPLILGLRLGGCPTNELVFVAAKFHVKLMGAYLDVGILSMFLDDTCEGFCSLCIPKDPAGFT
jgi:hypothetical protein